MRLASESAEEEEIRLSRRQSRDRAKRAVQSSQATKNCRGSETAEARERTDSTEIEERGVSIQKARRKRTHDIDNVTFVRLEKQFSDCAYLVSGVLLGASFGLEIILQ